MRSHAPFFILRWWPFHLSVNEGRGPINFGITFDVTHALCFLYVYIKVYSRTYRIEKFIMDKKR